MRKQKLLSKMYDYNFLKRRQLRGRDLM